MTHHQLRRRHKVLNPIASLQDLLQLTGSAVHQEATPVVPGGPLDHRDLGEAPGNRPEHSERL